MVSHKKVAASLIALIAFFSVMVAGAWAAAPAPVISYSGQVNVANSTAAVAHGAGNPAVGSIVITAPVAGDLVSGSSITVEAPADTKFVHDFSAGAVKATATGAVRVAGTNAAVYVIRTAQFNSTSTKLTLPVTTAAGANDTLTIAGLEIVAKKTSNTTPNTDALKLKISANDGTSAPTTGDFGTIRLVQVPKLVKAVLVSSTAVDLYFNTDIAGNSTDDPFGANELLTANTGTFQISTANVTASTLALDYNSSTNPTGSKKLVHVTGLTGVGFTGVSTGDTVTLLAANAAGAGDVENRLTNGTTGPINQGTANGTAVSVQPQDDAIASVTITDAEKVYGYTAFNGKNVINATVVGTPGAVATLRMKSADGLITVNADTAASDDTGIAIASSDGTVTARAGIADTLTIPASGTAHITLTLTSKASPLSDALAANTKVTEGIVLQVSTDEFALGSTDAADTITVDREGPAVVISSGKAVDNTTLQVTFNESVAPTALTPGNYTIGGANAAATVTFVELDDTLKVATLHTSLLTAATNNTIAPTATITDLVGNAAVTTATSAFDTAGQALTSVSFLSNNGAASNPAAFVTKVNNGAVLNTQVQGPTGLAASIAVRAVDANDKTFVVGAATTSFAGTETSVGVYESNGANSRVTLANPIASSVTSIILQASSDSFVTMVESDPIDVDNTAPKVESATAAGSKGVKVVFTEPVSEGDAETTTAALYVISGSGVPALTVTAAVLQPDGKTVLLTTTEQKEGALYTVDIATAGGAIPSIYDAANNALASNTNALTIDRANFTGAVADTEAPVFSDPQVNDDLTNVTITITDKPDENPSGVNINNSQITAFTQDGVAVAGTATKTAPDKLVFTPAAALENGVTYVVTVRAEDNAGNQRIDNISFTTEDVVPGLTVTPAEISTYVGADATEISVSAGIAPYSITVAPADIVTIDLDTLTGEGTVTVTPVAKGTATITVTDSASPAESKEIAVTVGDEPVVAPTPVPTAPVTVTPTTAEEIAAAKLNLGSIASGGNSMEFSINLPAYEGAVDIYFALGVDGTTYVLNSDGDFVLDLVPYVENTTDAATATIFDAFNVCPSVPFAQPALADGGYAGYWLVFPAGTDVAAVDWDNDAYEFGYYTFEIDCVED